VYNDAGADDNETPVTIQPQMRARQCLTIKKRLRSRLGLTAGCSLLGGVGRNGDSVGLLGSFINKLLSCVHCNILLMVMY
jgi:hypothetical protein